MITMEKILCPVDFFPASDEAVTYAAGLAANYDASIHLLHVVTPIAVGTYEYAIDTDEIMRSMEEKSMEQLNKLVARVKKAGVAVTSELRTGDVYEEIKGSIVDVKPNLIVMGTHERRGVERCFIGSTTEKLLRHSPVPLVTISAAGDKALSTPQFRRILVTTDFSEGTVDETLHHTYELTVLEPSKAEVLVSGGGLFPVPRPASVSCASVLSSFLKLDGVYVGLRMKIRMDGSYVVTSRVRRIGVIPSLAEALPVAS